ncbi:hypothetical protein EI94DRAFT_1476306, partial [Lactarius quietus]
WTKSFVKSVFGAEYRQAILELEAEQKLLCLCTGHWKAEVMIGQAFLRRSDTEAKVATQRDRTTFPTSNFLPDPKDFLFTEPLFAAPNQQVWEVPPMKPAKRTLETTPGPKSSTASQVPKPILTSKFPDLTDAPNFLQSMNVQPSFKQGETSENVTALLERVQLADPASPDIDEDNMGQSWGHYQFTAGSISPSSSLTTWQDVGSIATA